MPSLSIQLSVLFPKSYQSVTVSAAHKKPIFVTPVTLFVTGCQYGYFMSEILQVGLGCGIISLAAVQGELRDGNGCQYANDRHDDQEFDKGETLAASPVMCHCHPLEESRLKTLE